jgi:general secretion pathway protein E
MSDRPARSAGDAPATVPLAFARRHVLLPGPAEGGVVPVRCFGEVDARAWWNLGVRLGMPLVARPEPDRDALLADIDAAYQRADVQAGTVDLVSEAAAHGPVVSDAELAEAIGAADRDLLASDGKAALVRLVDRLLLHAVEHGASDLHLQPTADGVLVRYRLDGDLDAGRPLPAGLIRPLVSRIKVMARMDVAERLVPQDGRTTVRVGDHAIDVRVSTIPTAYGERVVLRLLDAQRQLMDLTGLGMPEDVAQTFRRLSARSSGIILVTGPTGSGKTTTLYATLRGLDAGRRNVMTIEDPIEYELSAVGVPVSQSQINLRKGVTFATGLRHILRQDPDIIMVGEIRDAETARIAIQASLTGHLVFSTLHTNDAASAITRLTDLGVEPYLVASSLAAVLAQRLVRTTCPVCTGSGASPEPGIGCPACAGNGYKGRCGLFELLEVDEAVRTRIAAGETASTLRGAAIERGMRSLVAAGELLVASGRTTAAEVERVIHHG